MVEGVADDAEEREELERLLAKSGAPCDPVPFILAVLYEERVGEYTEAVEEKVEREKKERGKNFASHRFLFGQLQTDSITFLTVKVDVMLGSTNSTSSAVYSSKRSSETETEENRGKVLSNSRQENPGFSTTTSE